MKFKFKIQKYQSEVVEDTVSVFNGQRKYEHTTYMRDMGTEYRENNKKTRTENDFISSEQRKYREILKDAMLDAGFVNYPAEWWHYCYGDKMWAAYSHKKYAIFDKVTSGMIPSLGETWED